MTEENLGRVFTALSKAMRVMCTNTEDLRGRWKSATESRLDGTWEGHFPEGELRERFNTLSPSLGKVPDTEEDAKGLIETLIQLHDFVEPNYYVQHPNGCATLSS
jgi:hypothetical protein